MKRARQWASRGLLGLVILSLGACNFPTGSSEGPNAIQTAAAATVAAIAQVQTLAVTLPATEGIISTEIPAAGETPAASETPIPPTNTPLATGCSDQAAFVTDVTVPDGADFSPDENFTKTWRMKNAGTCTWTSSYALVFDHGDQMGGAPAVALTGTVPPGATVDLSVDLQAPAGVGTYQGFWRMRNNNGVIFGLSGGAAFWVKIDVPATPTPTPTGLIFVPAITLLPIVLFHSNGAGQIVLDGACFDADEGNGLSCGSGSADFRYNYDLHTSGGFPPTIIISHWLEPKGSVTLGFYPGGSAPTKANCQALGMSGSRIDLNAGAYYCYKTSDGRIGYLKPTGVGETSMTFNWATFN
jgi:hypothetical protein